MGGRVFASVVLNMTKPTGQRWTLGDQHQLTNFVQWVNAEWQAGRKPVVQMMKGERSGNQNAMIYGLYGDIARLSQDKSTTDVKRECKLYYGIPILRAADPAFCEWYDNSVKRLTLEDKLMLMTYMDVTSLFTKEQATEYIDTIITEYTRQGLRLIDPRR